MSGFTCVGLSYNIVDGIIGGLIPVLALYLFARSCNVFSFLWLIVISAIISSVSYFFMGKKRISKTCNKT